MYVYTHIYNTRVLSPTMIFKYGCPNTVRSVVLAGPRLAPLRMRGTRPMTLSGGCAWFSVPNVSGGALGLLGRTFCTHMANVSCVLSAAWVLLAPEGYQQRTGAIACML